MNLLYKLFLWFVNKEFIILNAAFDYFTVFDSLGVRRDIAERLEIVSVHLFLPFSSSCILTSGAGPVSVFIISVFIGVFRPAGSLHRLSCNLHYKISSC